MDVVNSFLFGSVDWNEVLKIGNQFYDRLSDAAAENPAKREAKAESILYFRVADIHAAHQALEAKGAQFLSAPHMVHRHEDGTEEWMAFLEDPDRRPLGLMASAKPG